MRNLYKILALGLAVLMCVGMLAVNVKAAVIEIKPGDKPPATNDPPNNPNENLTHGDDPTTAPEEKPNDEPEDPYDYYDGGDYFEDSFDEDDVEETKAEEKKKEEKTEEEKKEEKKTGQGGEYGERILKLIFRVGNKDMEKYINEDLTIIKMDAAPYIKDGRNMVGVRYVAEGLEMQVTWDAKTRTVFIEDDMFKIEIPVDTNKIIVNGQVMESDVMPEFVNGRTMLPIANIARALGLKDGEDIFWDNVEKKATIIRVLSAK
ncbi:MAG: copper amine oxidase N-terminal domain-containing protein [Ezakiella massiliensis]